MDKERLLAVATTNSILHPFEIDFLRRELDARRQEIARLTSECNTFEAFLSPLRRNAIPPEILGEIFVHVLAGLNKPITDQVKDICLVCRAWRAAALATPQLWATISNWIVLDPLHPIRFEKLQAWVNRAASLPKAISLHDVHNGESGQSGDSMPCLSSSPTATFLVEGPTLGELRLSFLWSRCFQDLISSVELKKKSTSSRSWDKLQSLEVEIDEWAEETDSLDEDILRHLPESLSNLSLLFPPFRDILDASPTFRHPQHLSLPHLTSLELRMEGWPANWMLECTRLCLALQSLTFDFEKSEVNWDNGPSDPNLPYILPELQTLRLRQFRRQQKSFNLMRFIQAPLLETLDIEFQLQTTADTINDLSSGPESNYLGDTVSYFVHKSNCANTLRSVRIHRLTVLPRAMKAILVPLRGITHLTLDHVQFDAGNVFSTGDYQMVLPYLHSLNVVNASHDFDYHSILTLAEKRSGGDILKEVRISVCRDQTTSKYEHGQSRAASLRDKGMDVVLQGS